MPKKIIVKGTVNERIYIFIQDPEKTDGGGKTGIAFDDAGFDCHFVRPGAIAVELALITQTVTGAHAAGGFVEVEATKVPGLYRLDLSNPIIESGVDSVFVMLKGTDFAPLTLELQLTGFDLSIATQPVNVTQIGGDTQSATDLKDFADDGYDPATNKVEGVKVVDTTTANTDMRGTDSAATAAALITHDDKLVVVDGVVDAILVDTNEMQGKLPTNNIMGSSDKTDKDDEIDAILADTADIQPKIGVPVTTLAGDIASNNTAITGISNVTRLNQAIPTYHQRPPSGDTAVRWDFALHDTDGNQEDPDGDQLAIKITNAAGTDLSARLFKENALTTVLDAGTGSFTGFVKLEKTATGRYFGFIKVDSADAEEEIRVELGWTEGGNDLYQFNATQILDATNDIAAVKADTAAILIDTNEMQGKLPTNNIMGSSVKADKDDEIDAILVDSNQIQGKLPDNNIMGSSVTTDKDDEIDAIKAKTDLLAFTAGNVHNHTKAQDDLALTAQQKLDVNTEVDTALDEAIAEPAQAAPANTISIRGGISNMWKATIDKLVVNKTTGFLEIHNAAGAVLWKKAIADDGNIYTETKAVSGP